MRAKPSIVLVTEEQPIKFIDLFAGIGGFHYALHELGGKCVFASEIDKFARKTYQQNYYKYSKEVFDSGNFVGDITKIDSIQIPDFDLLCAGFPCQPFSQAGFKKGFGESRGGLFNHIVNIIKVKKPKAFFLENVRYLLNHDNGKTFKIMQEIIEKDLNYSFFYKVIKASDFGLPQHRPRLFMVGFEKKNINFKFPEPGVLNLTMSDIMGGQCNKRIGYTLRVGGRGSGIEDRRNWDCYLVDNKVRRLTSVEGKRMMGFPEDFVFPVSETQSMRQLGNSVAVPAIKAVTVEIIKNLRLYG